MRAFRADLALMLFIAIIACTTVFTCAAENEPPKFEITTKRGTDKVIVKFENGKTIFWVNSPFGISQAIVKRTNERWPNEITLRLRLKGLEQLQITNGKIRLNASVSSSRQTSDSDRARTRLWMDSEEEKPLSAKSPFWMEIRIIEEDLKSTEVIPLVKGYFEMEIPKALFEDNPESITVEWIDFFRS